MWRCLCLILLFAAAACRADQALFPYTMPWNDSSPNLTNLSDWNEKPAGKHGFVAVRDGHLFAGDKRLRLLGVNIVFGGCFPTREEADGVAARLARLGVNIVRFHHMDSSPAPRGLLQKDLRTIDPAQLDRLDYFIAALKREGIYSNLNLHVGRKYPGFADWGTQTPKYWKGVDNFYPPMIAMQKDYARDLLTHVNAYTGKAYTEEPAIALIEINNENGLMREWRTAALNEMPEPYRSALHARWTQWLKSKHGDDAGLARAWGAREVPLGPEMLGGAINVASNQAGWSLQVVGQAQASAQRAADGVATLQVSRAGAERWHVQWHQTGLRFKAGEPYTLKLRLRADKPTRIKLMAMQAHAPWAYLWNTELSVDTEWRDYAYTFAPTESDDIARLTIGELGAATGALHLASASLRPGGKLGLAAGESLAQGSVALATTADFLSRTLQGQRDWLHFLWDTELAYWRDMQHYLRDTLGARSLIIGTQVSYSPAGIQAALDVVDGHAYWQHPHFPGVQWDMSNWRIGNSPMAGVDGAGTLADLALRRVPGKPFVVTEYNHSAPSEYAAESLPLLAAYAALQDWDGIFIYSYGAHDGNWQPAYQINFFDTHADPLKMSSLAAAASLFRRGDVSTPVVAPVPSLPQAPQIEALRRNYKMPSADMWGAPRNAALLAPVSIATPAAAPLPLPLRSQGGQLVWGADKQATVTIDTPRSKGLIGAPLAQLFDADGVGLQVGETRRKAGVLLLNLMQGQSFRGPARILVTALGTQQNTDQRWQDEAHTTLGKQFGKGPVLVEGLNATIHLPLAAQRVTAWALDERGKRRAALKVTGDQVAILQLGPQYRSLWYEIEIGE